MPPGPVTYAYAYRVNVLTPYRLFFSSITLQTSLQCYQQHLAYGYKSNLISYDPSIHTTVIGSPKNQPTDTSCGKMLDKDDYRLVLEWVIHMHMPYNVHSKMFTQNGRAI